MRRKTLVIASIVAAAISLLFFIPGVLHIITSAQYVGAMGFVDSGLCFTEKLLYITDSCCTYFAGGFVPLLGASVFFLLSRMGKRRR